MAEATGKFINRAPNNSKWK